MESRACHNEDGERMTNRLHNASFYRYTRPLTGEGIGEGRKP